MLDLNEVFVSYNSVVIFALQHDFEMGCRSSSPCALFGVLLCVENFTINVDVPLTVRKTVHDVNTRVFSLVGNVSRDALHCFIKPIRWNTGCPSDPGRHGSRKSIKI